MNLFLDMEWADDAGRELVSVALASEDAQHVFYAELDPLPGWPTDWVSWVVYPRLCRGCCALPDPLFTAKLRTLLYVVPMPVVYFDTDNDLALLEWALAGFGQARNNGGPPVAFGIRKLAGRLYEDAIQTVFSQSKEANRSRHNALVDAFAMRQAYHCWRTGTIPHSDKQGVDQ